MEIRSTREIPAANLLGDGLNGGVTPDEAVAQAVESSVRNLWNSPDPCVKAYFEQHYGARGTEMIAFFSVYSLAAGPQNIASGGAEGARSQLALDVVYKGFGGAIAKWAFPNAAPAIGKWLGRGGVIASILASYLNVEGTIKALDTEGSGGQCSCSQ